MSSQVMAPPSGAERRMENLALAFQELLTVGERLRSHRQQLTDANTFREQIWEAVKIAQGDAMKRGYNGDDVELAVFAVIAFLDECVLLLQSPISADWRRLPMQQQRYGHDIAGETFFQNLQKLLARSETHDLADLLEVYYLCLLLGFAGRYSIGGRGELAALMQTTADKIRRIRGSAAWLSPYWMLPNEQVRLGRRSDPVVRTLLILTIVFFILMIVLFLIYNSSLNSGVSEMKAISR
jgi:type VI secretion system protein ImpK